MHSTSSKVGIRAYKKPRLHGETRPDTDSHLLCECRRCFPPLVLSRSGSCKGQRFHDGTASQPFGSPSSLMMPGVSVFIKMCNFIDVLYEIGRALRKHQRIQISKRKH